MKQVKLLVILVIAVTSLSGCILSPTRNVEIKEKEVKEYNKLVDKTLNSYVESMAFANINKEGLYNYMLRDTAWDLYKDTKNPLTDEEKEAFKTYSLIYDKYFTSLGAEGLREVVILNGKGYRMYVTVIWGTDKVHSVDRKVIKL